LNYTDSLYARKVSARYALAGLGILGLVPIRHCKFWYLCHSAFAWW